MGQIVYFSVSARHNVSIYILEKRVGMNVVTQKNPTNTLVADSLSICDRKVMSELNNLAM